MLYVDTPKGKEERRQKNSEAKCLEEARQQKKAKHGHETARCQKG